MHSRQWLLMCWASRDTRQPVTKSFGSAPPVHADHMCRVKTQLATPQLGSAGLAAAAAGMSHASPELEKRRRYGTFKQSAELHLRVAQLALAAGLWLRLEPAFPQ